MKTLQLLLVITLFVSTEQCFAKTNTPQIELLQKQILKCKVLLEKAKQENNPKEMGQIKVIIKRLQKNLHSLKPQEEVA